MQVFEFVYLFIGQNYCVESEHIFPVLDRQFVQVVE